MREIKLEFDEETLRRYEEYYFQQHPKAKKKPIAHPYHESINTWMIMKRPMMNALKQRWKEFIVWFVDDQGYTNLHIKRCEMIYTAFYPNHRRHDTDNSVPKFINDGFVMSGMIEDDDSEHICSITLKCGVDVERPRTEILIKVYEEKENI